MKKQTAVEWLQEEYMRILKDNDISVLQAFEILDKYNQAKEMEKEQIKEAYKDGSRDLEIQYSDVGEINSQQYYNETYGDK